MLINVSGCPSSGYQVPWPSVNWESLHQNKNHRTNDFLQTMAYHADKFEPQVRLLLVLCLHLWWVSTSATGKKERKKGFNVIFNISTSATGAQTPLVGCCPRKSHLGKNFLLIRFASNKATSSSFRGNDKYVGKMLSTNTRISYMITTFIAWKFWSISHFIHILWCIPFSMKYFRQNFDTKWHFWPHFSRAFYLKHCTQRIKHITEYDYA